MEGRDYLRPPIQLAEQVKRAIDEADSFKQECFEIGKKIEKLGTLFKKAARLSTSPSFYEHPTRRIMEEGRKTMERTLALVKKCKRSGVLKRVITITSATDFQKLNRLLDSTTEDLNFLLAVAAGGGDLGLPPIAANDPPLAFVWTHVARVLSMNQDERADGAAMLALAAQDGERYGKVIVEEGGLVPLMKLLQDGTPAGQEAAAKAIGECARDQQRAQEIVKAGAIQTFIHVLADAPVKVQTETARALAAIVSLDTDARSAFGAAGAIRLLVALINDTIDEASKTNMHTVVKTRMAQNKSTVPSKPWNDEDNGRQASGQQAHYPGNKVTYPRRELPSSHVRTPSSENGKAYYSHREHSRRDRELETPETIYAMRAEVLRALWKLAINNNKNCKSITDTRALLCFAKLMEKEGGEVQRNAVMAVAEIAAVAEHDQELRRVAFKISSPAVKAVVDQLLRVIQCDDPDLQIPSLKAIGCLARIFPAKETHIVRPITDQLGKEAAVASEAAAALQKFTVAENYLKVEHSKTILDANGAPQLVQLTYFIEAATQNAVILLCYLALNVGEHPALKSSDVLKALQAASRNAQLMQVPLIRDMLPKAIEHLELYQAGDAGAAPEDEFDYC